MGGKKPLRRPLWPPTRATASNYYPLGLDGAGGAAKPLLRAPKKPAPLHGRLPAFSGAVDAFERARKCFLEWRYFFSIILSEFLKNRVALQVNQQLAKMLFTNPHRMDYYDRYQEIIDAYNAEQNRATIEKTFMDLMELANSLDTEQQRYVREGFSSDEELSVYDLLFSENLTKQEIETIKKVSVDLLTKIKQQIAKLDHWTDKQETKAIVDNLIRNTLWQELPNSYDVSDIQTYQKKIYEYVYMRYPEVA